jgi:hypothetical protein
LNYSVATSVKPVERFFDPKLVILDVFGDAKWLNTKFERNSGRPPNSSFFSKITKIMVMFFTTAIYKLLVTSLLRA